ncbi:ferritin-like domain-containing protein [Halorarum halobium]|uniref:ferritin-like domain-containing protein n=1 Tax=Halorarum halobium TaxID=3075121 RepID=UPI0028A9D36C|nr:ferritin-like domain-containing protein [Halobaculum sp. XH14]
MTTGPESDEHGSIDSDTTDRPTMREMGRQTPSRRGLLLGTGVAVGAGLLGVGGSALAQQEGGDGDGTDAVPDEYSRQYTDVDVLSYALMLERLEDAFYAEGLDTFSEEDVADSDALEQFGDGMTTAVWEYLTTVGDHESTHVDQLARVIEALGGDPGEAPEFTFGFETFDEFLATAQVLENTGVAAYAGAAPAIESPDVLSAALSIHSVEARHAAFLNLLTGASPFPNAFDEAMSIPEVLEAIQPFLPGDEETDTPEEETDTPEEETDTPEEETDTPEDATETPEEETDTPGEPTETPEGTDVPEGTDTPSGTETPTDGTDAPGTATDTPTSGTGTPGEGTGTPVDGTDSPPGTPGTPPSTTDTPGGGT